MNTNNNLLFNLVATYKYTRCELSNSGMSTRKMNQKEKVGLNDRTFYLIVAMAMGAAIAPLGAATAFGQEQEQQQEFPVSGYGVEKDLILFFGMDGHFVTEFKNFTNGQISVLVEKGSIERIHEDTVSDAFMQYGYDISTYAPMNDDEIRVIASPIIGKVVA